MLQVYKTVLMPANREKICVSAFDSNFLRDFCRHSFQHIVAFVLHSPDYYPSKILRTCHSSHSPTCTAVHTFPSWWLLSCQPPGRALKLSPTCICSAPYSGVLTSCLLSGLPVGQKRVTSHPKEEWFYFLANSCPSIGLGVWGDIFS